MLFRDVFNDGEYLPMSHVGGQHAAALEGGAASCRRNGMCISSDGLGDFIELEVLLDQDDDEAGGEEEAHAMFKRLGVEMHDLVPLAYVDLLNPAAKAV